MKSRKKFRFNSEHLEPRCVLAGNVNVVLSGTTLKITGDVAANDITIIRTDATHLQITGNNGTNILLNGTGAAAQQTVAVADFTKLNLTIDTKEGDDVIAIGDTLNEIEVKGLSIKTGTGADNVSIQNFFMSGTGIGLIHARKANTATEADNDIVAIHDSGFVGSLQIFTGFGDDEVTIDQTSQVDRTLGIDTSGGNDLVTLNTVVLNKAAGVLLGDGDDNAFISAVTLNGTGTTKLNAGAGNDQITVANIIAQHAMQVDLEKSASGTGNNALNSSNIQATKIVVNGGNGVEQIGANTIAAPTMEINTKGGADFIQATGITSLTKLKVDAGAGDNDVVMATLLNTPVSLTVDGGAGIGDVLNFTTAGSTLPPGFGVPPGPVPKNFETMNIS